jgi:hypothetical protein
LARYSINHIYNKYYSTNRISIDNNLLAYFYLIKNKQKNALLFLLHHTMMDAHSLNILYEDLNMLIPYFQQRKRGTNLYLNPEANGVQQFLTTMHNYVKRDKKSMMH